MAEATSKVGFLLRLQETGAAAIQKIQQGLAGLEEKAKSLQKASMAMVDAGTKIGILGATMVAAFAIPVKYAADLEKEISNVAAISGSTANELNQLNEAARSEER